MSIASEISRLQSAKSCIKAAIESKGVSVGSSVKLDCYADCVDAISGGGGGGPYVNVLVVGGGGQGSCSYGSGGGGGAVCCEQLMSLTIGQNYTVTVGCCNGQSATSCFNGIVAPGGCNATQGGNGGNSGSGCVGSAGGGGGASSNGFGTSYCGDYSLGGHGLYGYGGGGNGFKGNYYSSSEGHDGGGGGSCSGQGGWNCGGGGSGAYRNRPSGAKGVVDICYACDGSRGINSATGGNSCYLCGNLCVHRFTSSGTFTIVS